MPQVTVTSFNLFINSGESIVTFSSIPTSIDFREFVFEFVAITVLGLRNLNVQGFLLEWQDKIAAGNHISWQVCACRTR